MLGGDYYAYRLDKAIADLEETYLFGGSYFNEDPDEDEDGYEDEYED